MTDPLQAHAYDMMPTGDLVNEVLKLADEAETTYQRAQQLEARSVDALHALVRRHPVVADELEGIYSEAEATERRVTFSDALFDAVRNAGIAYGGGQ